MRRFMKWFQKTEPKVSKLLLTANLYSTFKHDRLKHVFSSDNSILQITVCKSTVWEYIKYLKMMNEHFKIDKQLTNIQLTFDSMIVYKRDFFVLKNGCYADPEKEYTELSEQAVLFLQQYDQKENTVEKSFAMEKNLLLTKHVVDNLIMLIEQL